MIVLARRTCSPRCSRGSSPVSSGVRRSNARGFGSRRTDSSGSASPSCRSRCFWSVPAFRYLPGVEFVPDADPLTGEGTEFAPAEEPAGPSLPGWPLNLLFAVVLAIAVGATINAVFAFGEEFGWRGVLLTELAPLGFWRVGRDRGRLGTLARSSRPGGLQLPVQPVLGVGVMTLACLAMSPVYTYLTVTARSVLAPSIFHGIFNAFAATMFVFAQGGSELLVNPSAGRHPRLRRRRPPGRRLWATHARPRLGARGRCRGRASSGRRRRIRRRVARDRGSWGYQWLRTQLFYSAEWLQRLFDTGEEVCTHRERTT